MEDWTALALLVALGFNLVAGAWNSAAAIRYRRKEARLDREAWGARPLLPPDKAEVLRPGDTVLMLLPLEGMTADQQTAMAGSIKAMAESAKARGIEFMVVPDREQKAIVVSRGRTSGAASALGGSEWDEFFRVWRENQSRDETLTAAAYQQQQRLQSLHRSLREKVLPLSHLQVVGLDAQGLLADLDVLEATIQEIAEGPYSQGDR